MGSNVLGTHNEFKSVFNKTSGQNSTIINTIIIGFKKNSFNLFLLITIKLIKSYYTKKMVNKYIRKRGIKFSLHILI